MRHLLLQGSRGVALDLPRFSAGQQPGSRGPARLDAVGCHRPFGDPAVRCDGDLHRWCDFV
eukprot:9445045-Pyramimonas_sp.AAC.2